MKFRKKPVVIDAILYDGENGHQVAHFMSCQYPAIKKGKLLVGTLEGVIEASPGDWVIKGVQGKFYLCHPDIFEKTYEAVEEKP